MQEINTVKIFFMLTAPGLGCSASAKEKTGDAAQANNPLANMKAFNIQNYYIRDISSSDKDASQFWFRYAQPFSLAPARIIAGKHLSGTANGRA